MRTTPDIGEVRRIVAAARKSGQSIGLVPTMGALHAGHRSLLDACRRDSAFAAVSIFVNPTQFGPSEDFQRYPRTLDADLAMCEQAGTDLVFLPEAETIYPPGFGTFVDVGGVSTVLEGHFRPGHFRGVATVVLKLFHIVAPDAAYFGQKDFQQQLLIRTMCRQLDLPVEIRTCPTVREPDGLALSSRNRYLSPDERRKALALSQSLRVAEERLRGGETDVRAVREAMLDVLHAEPGVFVDYAAIADPSTLSELTAPQREMVALVAARVGSTRLIDNAVIALEAPPGPRGR